jgi:hypothetical protein
MRKIFFSMITLLVIGVSSASAQAVWGARVGLSSYTETVKVGSISASASAPGFELGPVLYYSLNDNVYINSGAMLGIMIPDMSDDLLERDSYQNYYLDIPLYLGVNIPIGSSAVSLFGQAGPYCGYWFASDELVNKVLQPFQAGLGLMAGINVKRFKFELGYKYGLTNLTSSDGNSTYEGTQLIESSSKLSSLFLGVSYVF